MNQTELKAKSINQIENQIRGNLQKSREAQAKAIKALAYLEKTGRFKENPQYRKSSFEKYLEWEHGMKYSRYQTLRSAITYWPEETRKYGPEVITKAINSVGVRRTDAVVSDLNRAQSNRKGPLPVEKIEGAIKAHKPLKIKPDKDVNWKAEAERWKRRAVNAEADNEALRRQVQILRSYVSSWLEWQHAGQPTFSRHSILGGAEVQA